MRSKVIRCLACAAWLTVAPTAAQDAPVAEPVPSPETSETEPPVPDAEIEEALRFSAPVRQLISTYRRIDGLRTVQVYLEGGILELSGTALSADDRLRAEELASLIVNPIFVQNRIQVETSLSGRLAPAMERIQEKSVAFLRLLPVLLVSLLIIGVTVLFAFWIGRPGVPYHRITRNPFAENLLRQSVRAVVVLTGVLLALDLLGATALVGAVLGAAGVMGLAVGFAFRDIVENYLAGILLSLRQPFAVNDLIQLSGEEGRVVRMTGRETILMTLDGNHVRIPNALVFKSVMVNLTRNPRRRLVIQIGIAPWEDVSRALLAGRETISSTPGVLETPPPTARAHELGSSSVELRFSAWVDQTAADFGKVKSEAIRRLKECYEREGIETPAPEYGVRILETPESQASARPPKVSGEPAESPTDVSPDTTIEDEIAREMAGGKEENLLRSPPADGPPS